MECDHLIIRKKDNTFYCYNCDKKLTQKRLEELYNSNNIRNEIMKKKLNI